MVNSLNPINRHILLVWDVQRAARCNDYSARIEDLEDSKITEPN